MWPGTNATIPTGWTRETSLDGRFVKQIPNSSTNPGTTGGAGSHSHGSGGTHTHNVSVHSHGSTGTSASASETCAVVHKTPYPCASGIFRETHTHSSSSVSSSGSYCSGAACPALSSTSAEPPNLVVIFIKSNGTPTGIPNSALAYFNSSAPTGWAQYTTGNNRLLKGAATGGDGGGTGGTGCSHVHCFASHTHSTTPVAHSHTLTTSSGSDTLFYNQANNVGQGVSTHTHTFGTTSITPASGTSGSSATGSGSGDLTPPWYKVLLIQNTSGVASLSLNIICLWLGTIASIPAKWKICDGLNSTPNLSQGKYVRSSDTTGNIGTAGGVSSHSHAGGSHTHGGSGSTHGHTVCANSSTVSNTGGSNYCPCLCSLPTKHYHSKNTIAVCNASCPSLSSASTATSATDLTEPTNTTVAYIQYTG